MEDEEMIANKMADTRKEIISLIEQEVIKAIDKLQKENAELKKQIEKMKPYCKGLCKNYIKTKFMGNDCYNGVCRNCDKWEL